MFHLFNNVYLSFDFTVSQIDKGMILSATYGQYQHKGDSSIRMRHINASYEELITSKYAGSDLEFFKSLSEIDSAEKTILFCDITSFMDILMRYLRSALPNGDAEAAYQIYSMYMHTVKNVYAARQPITDVMQKRYRALSVMDEGAFDVSFRKTPKIENFTETVIAAEPIEFLLATALVDTDSRKAKLFEKRMISMAWAQVAWEIEELKQNMLSCLFDLPTLYPELESVDLTNKDLIIAKAPMLAFLFDDDCNPHNTPKIQSYGAGYFKEAFTKYFSVFGEESLFIETLLDLLADPQCTGKDLIDFDMSFKCGTQLLAKSDFADTLNCLFISYLYGLYRKDETAKLKAYSLG